MSLEGKTVVVTRAPHQAGEMINLLRQHGAVPLVYPCIDIAPIMDDAALDSALRNLAAYDWLLLTSHNTVIALRRRLDSMQLSPEWSNIRVAAVGPSTAAAAETHLGIAVDTLPDDYTAAALAEALPSIDDQHVLLPQSNIAKPDLAEALTAKGVDVTQVPAYRTVIGRGGENMAELLERSAVDALTFTSGSTVMNFIQRLQDENDTITIPYDLPAVCVGPRTEETAIARGFSKTLVPERYTITAMIKRLEEYFA